MSRDSLILGDMMLEIGVASINKEGEVICGDVWCQTSGEEQQIIVLSDGSDAFHHAGRKHPH